MVDSDLSRAVEVDSGGWIALPLVANAGRYACAGGMRIINAVAMAVGYTDPTKERDMLVARAISDGRQVSAGREVPVVPGDVIAVLERFI